jgi:hypothetical protein
VVVAFIALIFVLEASVVIRLVSERVVPVALVNSRVERSESEVMFRVVALS